MVRRLARSVCVCVVLVSCSSPPKSPEADDTSSSTADSSPPPTHTTPSTTASAVSDLAQGKVTDRELTAGDCRVLGDKFRSLTISDNQKFVKPELDADARAQGEKSIAKAANTLADSWTEGCYKSNVGSFAPEESLQCAMSAKTVDAFDTCLNAPLGPKK